MTVIVYTRNACAACKGTEALLDKLGVEYVEINVQAAGNENHAQQLVDEGFRAMPVVKVYQGLDVIDSWAGTNQDKIRALAG